MPAFGQPILIYDGFISRRSLPPTYMGQLRVTHPRLRNLKTSWDMNLLLSPVPERVTSLIASLHTLDVFISTVETYASVESVLSIHTNIRLEKLGIELDDYTWSRKIKPRRRPEEHPEPLQAPNVALARLRQLKLTNFDLKTFFSPLNIIIDVNSLTSLGLSRCKGTTEFFTDWVDASKPKDTTFSLQHINLDIEKQDSIKEFLTMCNSLESVHLYLDFSYCRNVKAANRKY